MLRRSPHRTTVRTTVSVDDGPSAARSASSVVAVLISGAMLVNRADARFVIGMGLIVVSLAITHLRDRLTTST